METQQYIGIGLIAYCALAIYVTAAKPKWAWESRKVKRFLKWFGEKGTIVFFYVWSISIGGIGCWLLLG